MFRRIFLVILLLFPLVASATVALVLPKPSADGTPTNLYLHQLLQESFTAIGKQATISYTQERMNQKRAELSLAKGEHINLTWLAKTDEREQQLLSVKVPLYEGLHGVRLLLIHQDLRDKFATITSLEQLKPLVALQKASWSDYQVLVANGLTVDGSLNYHSMFKAIDKKLGDYFPRSAMTVAAELRNNNTGNLIIEPHLSLHYDNFFHFYVSKSTPELAAMLTLGLNKLIATGRFKEIFDSFFKNRLDGLNLESRTKLYLTLPNDFSKVAR